MFTRRQFLLGSAAGLATMVRLPWLEAMETGEAPRRAGLYFWGNGVRLDDWIPAPGAPHLGAPLLQPLTRHAGRVALISGARVVVPEVTTHLPGAAGLLSGAPLMQRSGEFQFSRATFDQRIAEAIGGTTPLRSLEVAAQPGAIGFSHAGPGHRIRPESSPLALYSRLFDAGSAPRSDEERLRLRLRQSVLSSVLEDVRRLRLRLGSADRLRLDAHASAIRDLENRIIAAETTEREACDFGAPPVEPDDLVARPMMRERTELMARMLAMALRCDLTRTFSFWYSDSQNDLLYSDFEVGHHALTHFEPGDQFRVKEIVTDIMAALALFLDELASVSEGERSLLDNCAILGTSDCAEGLTHSNVNTPLLLCGSAGGRLQPGQHVRLTGGEPATRAVLTLARAVGMPWESFGEGELEATDSITALER